MAYADLWNLAATEDGNFQHMSYVAAWIVAQDIAGRPIGAGPNETTGERKDWAAKVMRESLNITARQLAFQMLRNPTVRAAGVAATDDEMRMACLEVLDDLVTIG